MKKAILVSMTLASPWAIATTDYTLPATDIIAEKQAAVNHPSGLVKVAAATAIKDITLNKGQTSVGQWTQVDPNTWQWELRFHSDHATSLNIGMSDVFLPHSAQLVVSGTNKFQPAQVFTDQNNSQHGFLWSGEIEGSEALITLTVDAAEKAFVQLGIDQVARGFHRASDTDWLNKSGSCNVDVACEAGEGWDADISSVGRYTFQTSSGGFLCTGQMINNTANDGTPYFLTADHCGYSGNSGQVSLSERQNVAASIQLIWNYQSQTCRAPGSAISGQNISTSTFQNRQSGASYVASNPFTDVALVELNQTPNAAYSIEYAGWDRSDAVPDAVTAIHHPSGHAKRISHENDPVTISSYFSSVSPGNSSHFRIEDWDTGTTEGGSSGSGLWNEDHLLVGQLHGGTAACGNDDPDWYGRLAVSWDHGTTANARLKDWLDPGNTGQMTLQGTGGCEAPSLEISVLGDQKAGSELTFSAQASGGAGGYSYEWDTNADDIIDAKTQEVLITYQQAFVDNISLKVTDSEGCAAQASRAITIQAPNVQVIEVQNIQSDLVQMCGNNDNIIDPGERWKTRLYFENQSNRTAKAAYAALAKGRGNNDTAAGSSDSYGNSSSSCMADFIDISQTGQLMAWNDSNPNDDYPGHDEGATANISIPNSALYGIGFSSLRASSNGYLSPGSINGSDFSNDCPMPQAPDHDSGSARIAPMHADLQNTQFYHQSFATCPRAAETGEGLACEIFMWQGADFWESNATENVDFQAILYPATGQWAYQYSGQDIDGSASTTGIQNAEANDGLTFACNQAGSISQHQAVCVYDKDHPNQSNDAHAIFLETPALNLGTLAGSGSTSEEVIFSVRQDAQCGKNFTINHQATVFDEGFNPGAGTVFEGTIGNNAECSVITHCDIDDSNTIQPRNGLWWNPNRSGNGHDMSFINKQRLMYVSYTGEPNRQPIWYITGLEATEKNQYFNELHKVYYDGPFESGNKLNNKVGWSNTTVLDTTHAVHVRQINDQLSAEKLTLQLLDHEPTPNMHTGFYYTPSESGWGESVTTMGEARGIVNYLYDHDGQPYWVTAWGPNDGRQLPVGYTESFCLHCPKIKAVSYEVGTVTMVFNGQESGTIEEFNVNIPEYLKPNATWSRSQLPMNNLVPPNQD